MKYNININQKVLSQYKELDLKDMAIFDYIKVMCSSVNDKIDKERFKKHTWINYDRLIEDMPALRIKSRNSITPRINKLEESGLVTVLKKMVKGHRRVFVRMTTLADSVFVENIERERVDEKRVRETVQDNSTIDNNTNDDISEQVAYNQKDYLNVMKESEKTTDRIIAFYLIQERVQLPSKAIAQETYRRHVKYAAKLTAWYDSDEGKKLLINAFKKAKASSEENNYKFTLETVYKFLTK